MISVFVETHTHIYIYINIYTLLLVGRLCSAENAQKLALQHLHVRTCKDLDEFM